MNVPGGTTERDGWMQPVNGTPTDPIQGETVPQGRLVRAAHEFEAQMMKELLKPMTASDPLTGDDSEGGLGLGSASGSGGALGEFATEALGRALSDRGGFGIATKIVHELSHGSNNNANGLVTAKVRGDTVMRTHK